MNLETFEKFSLMHAIVVIVSALIVAIVVFLSRKIRAKSPAKADRFRLGMGIAVVAFQILHNIYWLFLRDNGFDLYESLPLHFCDISGLVAAAALLFPLRKIVTLLYFWGVGLSITALCAGGDDRVRACSSCTQYRHRRQLWLRRA